MEAHLLTSATARPAIEEALKMAKGKSHIAVNLQGITSWDKHADITEMIASQADIVIGNQEEQAAFQSIAHSFQRSEGQIVITTKGENGVEAVQGDEKFEVAAKAPKNFVSSVGAGDGFIAGFLLAQSKGKGIEESMKYGVQVATAILEEQGARPPANKSLVPLFPSEEDRTALGLPAREPKIGKP